MISGILTIDDFEVIVAATRGSMFLKIEIGDIDLPDFFLKDSWDLTSKVRQFHYIPEKRPYKIHFLVREWRQAWRIILSQQKFLNFDQIPN